MKKILIIRFSSIGDIILTTPVIRCLKTGLPDAEIHYLTKKQNQSILQENPWLTRIWLYEKNFKELLPQLKAEKFDFIVDLHKNLRSRYLLLNLRKPCGTFQKLNLKKWLIVNFRVDRLPRIHIVDRYFSAVKPLGIVNDRKGLDYFIPSGEEVDLSILPDPFRAGFVAFVIGGKHRTKIFPEEKVAQVCTRLSQPVVLLGGKEDVESGNRIVQLAGSAVYNACGRFSINQSASLIRQAAKVITNDTGLMHIAAAFGKDILSVWGNTIPEFGMFPYVEGKENAVSRIFEVKGLSCRPCSKIGFEKCPKGHFRCMLDQDTAAMISALNQ
ncbi:MAG: glycosyltransferase family 9 protein [Bacteroidetes bacterium]|nr:glycosyltransferase family 9 protein [Bacteroidota bacterium]